MSETITKKKKVDFELLRKLEDEYDDAVEDADRKERRLIEKVHEEYLKADNKGEFFKELQKSESWYYSKFREFNFDVQRFEASTSMKDTHTKYKIQSIVDDLDEMEEEIPVLEVDEALKDGTEYIDPAEKKREWIQRTKDELLSEEPKQIVSDSNFGKYQQTKQMLVKVRDISKFDFDVSDNYKKILIHQLKKTVDYLNKLMEEIN